MYASHQGEIIIVPPSADDASFAQRFLDDLIERVRDVPTLKADVGHLKDAVTKLADDHDTVVRHTFLAGLLKNVGTAFQAIIVIALVPLFYLLTDLRDSKISQQRDISDIRQTMQSRAIAPSEWGQMQQNVADLATSNDRTAAAVDALSVRVDDLTKMVARSKPPRVEVHPSTTNTIILPKPDQSRANRPYQPPTLGPR